MNEDGTPSERLDSLALSIAQELGSNATTVEEAKEDPLIIRYTEDGLARANEESISRAAKVQVRLNQSLNTMYNSLHTLWINLASLRISI